MAGESKSNLLMLNPGPGGSEFPINRVFFSSTQLSVLEPVNMFGQSQRIKLFK